MTQEVIKPNISDYVNESGAFSYDGCEYDTAQSLVECCILGFCGCGIPDETRAYVEEGLSIIDDRYDFHRRFLDPFGDEWAAFFKVESHRIKSAFHSDESWYFFLYWCNAEDLVEHGSSLPGWLTEKGKNLLSLLRQVKEPQP